jgi:hypothetical protein
MSAITLRWIKKNLVPTSDVVYAKLTVASSFYIQWLACVNEEDSSSFEHTRVFLHLLH